MGEPQDRPEQDVALRLAVAHFFQYDSSSIIIKNGWKTYHNSLALVLYDVTRPADFISTS